MWRSVAVFALFLAVGRADSTCGSSQDFMISHDGTPAFTVSSENRTCLCEGGYSTRGNISGNIFLGDGSHLTNLTAQPDIAVLLQKVTELEQKIDAAVPVGAIWPFAGPNVPSGWLACNGSLYAIPAYPSLYDVLHTSYGGDGLTTFAVPDLRGRVAMGIGSGPGLASYDLGQMGGAESHTLTNREMPMHNHEFRVSTALATASGADGGFLAKAPNAGPTQIKIGVTADVPADATMNANAVGIAGESIPFSIQQPFTSVQYIIKY